MRRHIAKFIGLKIIELILMASFYLQACLVGQWFMRLVDPNGQVLTNWAGRWILAGVLMCTIEICLFMLVVMAGREWIKWNWRITGDKK